MKLFETRILSHDKYNITNGWSGLAAWVSRAKLTCVYFVAM